MKTYFLLLPILLMVACTSEDPVSPGDIDPMEPEVPIESSCNEEYTIVNTVLEQQIQATTDFAFDLFQKSTDLESGNLIQSPVSIYSALLMVYEGAACETKAQISQALRLGAMDATFPNPVASYSTYLDWLEEDSDAYSLTISNAIFSDPNRVSLQENFKNKMNGSYGAELSELDFSSPSALEAINQWAADNTEGKIEEVLDEINGEDVAFLMNALYFKADWENGFAAELTWDASFTKMDGEMIDIPFMSRDAATSFNRGDILNMVELPLKDNKYLVNIFTPSVESVSIDQIIQADNFKEVFINSVNSCEEGRLQLNLPKFELKGKQNLNAALQGLGMIDAFSESNADLTPMGTASAGKLFVSKALHDTYIKLDEQGVEGAAVTTIGIGVTSLPPSIIFDRPFAFVIRKADSFVPLFIGKVENPLE